jgi:deleted-in-malignant-brain-tumors protein 1
MDGEVRLRGGDNVTLGRVEVCLNNAWGTVCNSRFGTNDARVICQQLGFSERSRAYTSTAMLFGQASGPIFLENLQCSGVEAAIFDCPQKIKGLHMCDHSEDAGVGCYGMSLMIVLT